MDQTSKLQLHQRPFINQRDTTWQHVYNSLKLTQKYSQLGKDHVLRKRMAKFFTNSEVNSPDGEHYYVNRRDNNMSERTMLHFSYNSILLYGIDFLNEKRIEQYFSPYMVTIDLHDDSHCSVIFESTECLIVAIYKTLKNNAQITFEDFKKNCLSQQQYLVQWNQLLPYYQLSSQRKLWFRILTEWDQNNRIQGNQSNLKKTYFLAKHNLLTILSQQGESMRLEEQNDSQIGNSNEDICQKYNKKIEKNQSILINNVHQKSILNSFSQRSHNQTKGSQRNNNFMQENRQKFHFRQDSRKYSCQRSMQSNKSRSRSRKHIDHYHNDRNRSHCLQNMLKCNCFKEQLIMHLHNQCSSYPSQLSYRHQRNSVNKYKQHHKSHRNRPYGYKKNNYVSCKHENNRRKEKSSEFNKSKEIIDQHSSISEQKQLFSDGEQDNEVQNLLKQFNKYQLFQKSSQFDTIMAQQNINPGQLSNDMAFPSTEYNSH